MKWLKHIINLTVWTLIGLYLLLIIAFRIPAVQRELGSFTATALSDKLGTRVQVGRIDLGFLNRLIIDDALIYDQQQQEMLRSARLSVKIDLLPLLRDGQIRISSAQVFGAHIRLSQASAESKPNFQFVLDSLASKDTTTKKPIDLRINSFLMRNSSVSFDRSDIAPTHGKFNTAHLKLTDISANIQLKTFRPDSIRLYVRKLAAKEQSGLTLDKLSLRLEAGRHYFRLQDFVARLPHSMLSIPLIEASYHYHKNQFDWSSLRCHGSIAASEIATADIAPLLPAVKPLHTSLTLSARFTGRQQTMNIPSFRLEAFDKHLRLAASGSLKKQADKNLWKVDVQDLSASSHTIEQMMTCMTKMQNPPAIIGRLGDIHLKGHAENTSIQGMIVSADLTTRPGTASVSMTMAHDKTFKGRLNTTGIELGQLLDDNRLGELVADITADGKLNSGIHAKGMVSKFGYNGYDFNNMTFDGTFNKGSVSGTLTVNDPNAQIDIQGTGRYGGKNSGLELSANISDFCPAALRLSNKWGPARFKAHVNADFTASDLNDAVGHLSLTGFEMKAQEKDYKLQQFHINTGYSEGRHYVTMNGDFGHAELVGRFNYATVGQSLINFVHRQLPTIPGLPRKTVPTDNDFLIRAEIYKTDWLENLLMIPLHASQPITLNGKVNDLQSYLYLNCTAPDIQYGEQHLKDIALAVTAPGPSLNCDIQVTKIMGDDSELHLSAQSRASRNRLYSTLRWDNNADKAFSGVLNADAAFETLEGQQQVSVDIKPSVINIGGAQWNVTPAHICYRKNHIDIDKFEVRHGNQYLTVSGTASKSENDSLSVDLNGIDVAYVLNLVNFHSVDFGGLASGRAYITAPFGNFGAKSQLQVSRFTFENGRMGTLDANVAWNQNEKQIDIHAIANDGPDAMTYINGYVSTSRNFIDLGVHAAGTHLDFMRSFASGFLKDIDGHAHGEVHVVGPLSTINLTGQIVVDGQATVKTTGCTYALRNDTVNFVPDDILLNRVPIFDRDNNRGLLSGGIHHKHLTHLTYDLEVEAENMLVYDFNSFGDNTFYGTVYGSGNVGIHGLSNELDMEVNITPHHGTTFVYNVSTPDAVSGQDFIKWNDNTYRSELDTAMTSGQMATTQSTTSDTYINFLINMTPDATVKLLMDSKTNDYITLNGSGTLSASYYNKGAFNMYGTYVVNHGTYGVTIQNIIKKNFQFVDGGSIVFRGNPYEAGLNLQAVYTVNGVSLADLNIGNSFSNNTIRVNCLMNITGQPAKPVVDFDLDMPTVSSDEKQLVRSVLNSEDEMNQQVLYLLGIGRFYPQGANNSTAQNERQQSQTSLAMQSLLSGTLSSQINNVLSQVIKSNNWNFGANISTGDEGWNNAEYEGLLSGRLLNNRLLINGQFGYRDNANTANTSFIGDFDIRYLLFPNGNLAIKMYNQTNDRYFTKSSLNTQGIGLILKKDFTNLQDLLRWGNRHKAKRKPANAEDTKK